MAFSGVNGLLFTPVDASGVTGLLFTPVDASGVIGLLFTPVDASGVIGLLFTSVDAFGVTGFFFTSAEPSGVTGLAFSLPEDSIETRCSDRGFWSLALRIGDRPSSNLLTCVSSTDSTSRRAPASDGAVPASLAVSGGRDSIV